MKLTMHDDLEIPQKMLELSAIAFSPMKSINISMKGRQFSSNGHHYRPHLTSASSDISTEHPAHVDDCEEDDDSRASSTLVVGNGESKLSNDINLPSPPSSTRSSFDANDVVTRDSFISNGDNASDHAADGSNFGSMSSLHNSGDAGDVILEGQSEQGMEAPAEELMDGVEEEQSFEDEIRLVTEDLVKQVIQEVGSSDVDSGMVVDEPVAAAPTTTDAVDDGVEELWKNFQIDFSGESILPSGLRLVNGVADIPFYRDLAEGEQPRFTNQLNFLKTVLTKYICRYKTAVPFLNPVDSVQFKIPNYYLDIRKPMDLTTIKNRINFLWYRSASECLADLRLIFSNCYAFNPPTNFVYKSGKKLEEYLDDKLKDMPAVETEIPCPPRPSVDECQKLTSKRTAAAAVAKPRTSSISEHSENGDSFSGFALTKVTTRSERGVMVRKPSKDLPAPISTPQPKTPTIRKVPLNEPMKYCLDFVKELFTKKHAAYAWPFWEPVNVKEYPDYALKVKRPINLSAIKTNIETGKYLTINDFANDMRLMFSNCLRYNTPEAPIIEQARRLREEFEFQIARAPDEWLHEKLVVVHHQNTLNSSRTTSPSVRFSASTPTTSSSKHHHGSSSGDTHKSKRSSTKSDNKKSHKGRNSVESSGHGLNTFSPKLFTGPSASSGQPQNRMEQLENQVATLTNALLMFTGNSGAGNPLLGALMNQQANVAATLAQNGSAPARGRPRKNGGQSKGPSPVKKKPTKKQTNSKKRKRHLSSDEESDSDQETGQVAEPFSPESIEDLKKLKNDLENLRAKDLQNVLRILQNTEPSLRCDDESNVEIDFEALKPKTLVALRKYVTSCMLNSKASPANHSASTSNATSAAGSASTITTTTTGATNSSNKKLCHSSNSLRSNSILDTDCDNSTINNWSRAGSRASDLQLSEESSSDSELDD